MVLVEHLPSVDTEQREFEQEDLPRLQALRGLYRTQEIHSDYERAIFSQLFPEEFEIEDFNRESVEFSPETKLTKEEQRLRRCLMWLQGYKPRKEAERTSYEFSAEDVPEFEVFFRKKKQTLLDDLNRLPIFERLNYIAQTDPRFSPYSKKREDKLPQQWLSRAHHTKHLAKTVSYSVLRLAITQPKEFIYKVNQDMHTYQSLLSGGTDDERSDISMSLSKKEKKRVNKLLEKHGVSKGTDTETALHLAVAYSKYLLTAAYLHDAATPALGDIFMKTTAEVGARDQQTVQYSEDRVLAEHIDQFIDPVTGFRTGLPQFIDKHRLNAKLLTIMVREMAYERDTCLGGLLMKNKRKFEDQSDHPLKDQQAYDLDQESGTVTNAMKWINGILKNGCRYFDADDPAPIGSFEERLRFFVYILATGKSKKGVRRMLKKAGISEERMYIAIEEFSVGQNMMLAQLLSSISFDKEMELVITRPADVKKAITMFVINQLFDYRSSSRASTEAAIQTVIACALHRGVITQELFEQRGDYEAFALLDQKMPLIPFLFFLMDQAAIVTNEEYLKLALSNTVLIHPAQLGRIIPWKPGTLVMTETGEIERYISILRRNRKEHHMINKQSLPFRLEEIETMISETSLYYAIILTAEQKETLDLMLTDDRFSEETRQVMQTALAYWGYKVT